MFETLYDWYLLGLFIVVSIFDALRDRWLPVHSDSKWWYFQYDWKWWRWHLVKWVAFFLPLMELLRLSGWHWLQISIAAVLCLLIWMTTYKGT